MKQTDVRRIVIFLPIVCLIFGAAVAYSQYRRMVSFQEQQAALQVKIDRLQQTIKETTGQDASLKIATFPRTVDEEPNFLNRLKLLAADSGVKIIRWTSTAKPAGVAPGTEASKQPPALKDVTEIASRVDIAGPYAAVRAFTVRALDSPRLLAINDIVWARDQKSGTKLSMTLSRYVTPPEAVSSTRTTAAPTSSTAGGSQ
jgi:hypothetical protein